MRLRRATSVGREEVGLARMEGTKSRNRSQLEPRRTNRNAFTTTPVLPSLETPLLLPGRAPATLDRKAATLLKRDG